MIRPPTRRTLLGAGLAAAAAPARARAAAPPIRLGVLASLSGAYTDADGQGAVIAVRMAVEDVRADHPEIRVEVLAADMQDKPDVGAGIARAWLDRDGVDAIVDVPNSAVALAVASIVAERDRVALFSGPATAVLTGASCGANHVHWTYDTWALAASTGRAVVADGGNSWFFISADYSFGKQMQADTTRFVTEAGGRVLGSAAYPFPETTDFSAYLLQARASGADVIALVMSGSDMSNCLKQAAEFGIGRAGGQRLAAPLMLITNVHAVGLEAAQGLVLTEPFYWDLTDGTRAFTARFAPQYRGIHPSMAHAGAHSATLHYLKAVASLGVDTARASGSATVARMKAMPTDDPLFGKGSVRADGRKLHDMYLFRVTSPRESRYPWDYYRLLRTIPAAQAFRPLAEGGCRLIPA